MIDDFPLLKDACERRGYRGHEECRLKWRPPYGAERAVKTLRDATRGLVPDAALRRMSNLAESFGLGAAQTADLVHVAYGASKALGKAVEHAFGELVVSTARSGR